MSDVFTRIGYSGAAWDIILGVADYLGPAGAAFGDFISVGGFQDTTHSTDSGMAADSCTPNHMRNCKYESPTEVSLNGAAAVTLDEVQVADIDCTLRLSYADDAPLSTALTNVLLFAYNGTDVNVAPVGVTVLAFERHGAGVNVDRSSDTPLDGGAWDATKGIGALANALICTDRISAATHYFYIGVSMAPTSKGQKSGKLRLEFDAA